MPRWLTCAGVVVVLAIGTVLLFQDRGRADFPAPPATNAFAPHAVLMTCHYIEQLPEKPKTNRELLLEYIRAYKNLENALDEADNSEYSIDLLPEKTTE